MRRAVLFLALLLICGCATQRIPPSFSRISSPGWATIEIRDDVDYDRAWKTTLGILIRDFDIEFLSKDDGYVRTSWTHTWSGVHQQNYRVRVTVRFSDDRHSVEIKSEAHALHGNTWLLGVDSRQLSTMKTDLMGTIGRTTR
jgi:hypothetical protein